MNVAMNTNTKNTSSAHEPRVSLTLSAEAAEYADGTLPTLRAVVKNTGSVPVKICAYMLRHRMLSGLTARDASGVDYGFYAFRNATWAPPATSDIRVLAPGQEIVERLDLSTADGWGFVRTGSQPPLLAESQKAAGFGVGTHTFNVVVFPSAAIYAGKSGVHDRTFDRKKLPQDLPAAGGGDLSDVFRGEIEGSTKVRFVSRR